MRCVHQSGTNPLVAFRFLAMGWAILSSVVQVTPAQVRIDTIALTGQEATGFEPPAAFSTGVGDGGFFTYRRPFINDFGQVVFATSAYKEPPGENYNDGIWSTQTDDSLRLVVRERDPAPGTNVDLGSCSTFDADGLCVRPDGFRPFQLLGLSDNGEAVFYSNLIGPDIYSLASDNANFEGIFSERGGEGLHLVARMGDPAPGTDTTFGRIETGFSVARTPIPVNDDGRITFIAELGNDSSDKGMWAEQPDSSLRLMVRTGEEAPGVGQPFDDFGFGHWDQAGNITFHGFYFTADGSDRPSGIWRTTAGGVVPLVLPGQTIPGVDGDQVFQSVRLISVSDSGDFVFSGRSPFRPAPDFSSVIGLFAYTTDGVRNVALEETPLDGVPDEMLFEIGSAVIDGQGRVAFIAEVSDEDLPGGEFNTLFAERNGALTRIVETDTLPGLLPNETVRAIHDLTGNSAGQLGLWATMEPFCENPQDPFACDFYQGAGYWLIDASGKTSLAIRTGDLIEVAPGDFREVSSLRSPSGQPYLNELGQFAFIAQFSDGTQGVFRAQLVPEPASWLLTLGGCALATLWRSRIDSSTAGICGDRAA